MEGLQQAKRLPEPPDMGNAEGSVDPLPGNKLGKLLHLSDASLAPELAAGDNGHARGVIAAVFQAASVPR